MNNYSFDRSIKLSIVIPCFNEELTLNKCIDKVLSIEENNLSLEIIIIDDGSSDKTSQVAVHKGVWVLKGIKDPGLGGEIYHHIEVVVRK